MMKRLIIFLLIGVAIASLYHTANIGHYLTLESLQSQRQILEEHYSHNPLLFIAIFFASYVFVTACSIPAATILTLMAGFVFGPIIGSILVSFASTLGACCAMLVSRYILREYFTQKFEKHITTIDRGIAKDGNLYLFALRLTPLFPFFMVNIIFGLIKYSVIKFFIISQIGMLPATIIYVYAGHQIATLTSLKDILSPAMILTLTCVGFFPIVAKKALGLFNKSQLDN